MAKPTTSTNSVVAAAADTRGDHGNRQPLLRRKMDTLYFVFFVIHIPVMLLIDLAAFYPASLTPTLSTTLRSYYITTFADRFFTGPPAWFTAYMYLELIYHLPISLWFVCNIPKDHPLIALNLLIFALETAITTLTCVVDTADWHAYSQKQRNDIYSLYLPYLILAIFMGVDAFFRVKAQVLGRFTDAGAAPVDGKAKRV